MKITRDSKFWFGNNAELVKKFRNYIEKHTGKRPCGNSTDSDIGSLYYHVDDNDWGWMPPNRRDYYDEQTTLLEVNPLSFFSWKVILGGAK